MICALVPSLGLSQTCHINAKPQIQCFVSPQGKPNASGEIEDPLSLEGARIKVRSFVGKHPQDIIINLRAGVYALTQTFVLTDEDSGTASQFVIWQNYQNERAIIQSASWAYASDWEPLPGTAIFRREIATTDPDEVRDVYFGDVRGTRAREPDASEGKVEQSIFRVMRWRENSVVIAKKFNCEILMSSDFILYRDWTRDILGIRSCKDLGKGELELRFRDHEQYLLFKRQYPSRLDGNAFILENNLSFLDEPGEFFFDPSTKYLYYRPVEGQAIDSLNPNLPKLSSLWKIEGRLDQNGNATKRAINIRVRGLEFRYTNYFWPNKFGFISGVFDLQALEMQEINPKTGKKYFQTELSGDDLTKFNAVHNKFHALINGSPPIAAVVISGAKDVYFENNRIRLTAGVGLSLQRQTKLVEVRGNLIEHTGSSGIVVGALHPGNEDPNNWSSRDRIVNNRISNVSEVYQGGAGIMLRWARFANVLNNDIRKTPYVGIGLEGGLANWAPHQIYRGGNIVKANYISEAMQTLYDAGAIYANSYNLNSPTLITENFISDVSPSAMHPFDPTSEYAKESGQTPWSASMVNAVQLDSGSHDYLVKRNVFKNISWVSADRSGTKSNSMYLAHRINFCALAKSGQQLCEEDMSSCRDEAGGPSGGFDGIDDVTGIRYADRSAWYGDPILETDDPWAPSYGCRLRYSFEDNPIVSGTQSPVYEWVVSEAGLSPALKFNPLDMDQAFRKSGFYGFSFSTQSKDLRVRALARATTKKDAQSQLYRIMIMRAGDRSIVDSVVFDGSKVEVKEGYQTIKLKKPIQLRNYSWYILGIQSLERSSISFASPNLDSELKLGFGVEYTKGINEADANWKTSEVPDLNLTYEILRPSMISNLRPGQSRNDYSGLAGLKILPQRNILVHEIGRLRHPSNGQTHALQIRNSDMKIVGSVTVSTSAPTDSRGFVYESLKVPVLLEAHKTYFLVSQETYGGDEWFGGDSAYETSSDFKILGGVWWDSQNQKWQIGNNNGHGHVGLNLLYSPQ